MKLSKAKISSRTSSYSADRFLILKRFDRHNKVIIHSTVTIVVASCETGGAKPKTGSIINFMCTV